jgi:hypothetical protein
MGLPSQPRALRLPPRRGDGARLAGHQGDHVGSLGAPLGVETFDESRGEGGGVVVPGELADDIGGGPSHGRRGHGQCLEVNGGHASRRPIPESSRGSKSGD